MLRGFKSHTFLHIAEQSKGRDTGLISQYSMCSTHISASTWMVDRVAYCISFLKRRRLKATTCQNPSNGTMWAWCNVNTSVSKTEDRGQIPLAYAICPYDETGKHTGLKIQVLQVRVLLGVPTLWCSVMVTQKTLTLLFQFQSLAPLPWSHGVTVISSPCQGEDYGFKSRWDRQTSWGFVIL